jgi:predicted AAA+ superfamily ATPase
VKEPKLYCFDFIRVDDPGARFENMVALELLRATMLWTDYGADDDELWYLRTKEKHEVDFLVTRDTDPLFMVEAKLSDTEISPCVARFQALLRVPAIQLVNREGIARIVTMGANRTLVVTAWRWLAGQA